MSIIGAGCLPSFITEILPKRPVFALSRLSRDHRLETRQARLRLKLRHEPYWRQIHHGLFVGYRKGAKGGVWVVRKLQDGRYRKRKLGIADDRRDANDHDVLSYKQAHLKAIAFAQQQTDAEHGLDYTVAQAMRDYLAWHRVHSRNYENTDSVIRANILPRLGRFRLEDLTTAILRRWHTKRAEIDSDDPERRRRRKATANRNLSVLKAALNHAWENGNADNAEIWRRVRPFKGVEAADSTLPNRSRGQMLAGGLCAGLSTAGQGRIVDWLSLRRADSTRGE